MGIISQKKFHLALFGDLMIVILHYSPKKILPAAAGIIWWFNTGNFTFSSAKERFLGDKMWSFFRYTNFTPPPIFLG